MIARTVQVSGARASRACLVACALVLVIACAANPLSRKYEYEEEIYVRLDGSATVYVNAAVPALAALRGMDLPVDPRARLDREDVRSAFEAHARESQVEGAPVARVANVSTSRRDGRRYVHLRLEVDDVRRLSDAAPFAWSSYELQVGPEETSYRQRVGEAAGRNVGDVGWRGQELVAFRLHLPSRVLFHNSPSRTIQRGNIIAWEQPLADRLRGVPVDIEVRMGSASILANTLLLFGAMIVVVALTFVAFIWYVKRRGISESTD